MADLTLRSMPLRSFIPRTLPVLRDWDSGLTVVFSWHSMLSAGDAEPFSIPLGLYISKDEPEDEVRHLSGLSCDTAKLIPF